MTTRLILVEDHPVVVDGLRAAFREHPEVEVVGIAATLAEGRRLVATTPCDVVLLDLRLPDGMGIELLRESRAADGPPSFLVLSSFLTPEYVSAAIALGAGGFLLKTAPVGEILAAVEAVSGGGLAFTPEQLRVSRNASWAPLTEREHEILDGILRGRSNDELAMDLGIAKKTVEGYITRLLARYDVMTRTELAVHAERRQLLDLPTRPLRTKPGGPA
ncbi:MAG: response regulator transcription factor [Candidatus Limnocylindrales bacterium]